MVFSKNASQKLERMFFLTGTKTGISNLRNANPKRMRDMAKTEQERKGEKVLFNHLTPNGHYMGRTAQLTSRCCILYIYSTNTRTEYFKHAA